ncbi:MAG TPA: hypothetical protein VG842_03045, partial [Sediminibacterium sp.]|nr:hypothetical protein [Sediminibacterium sp.]
IGLLLVQYLIKKQGIHTWYLGANVPINDLAFVAGLKKESLIFTHLTSLSPGFQFDKFLHQLADKLPDHRFIISGPVAKAYQKVPPPHFELKKSITEMLSFVNQL